MDIKIDLHPRQVQALNELKRQEIKVEFFGGARGGGKSFLSRAYAILRALKYPRSNHLILRRSFPELFRTHTLGLQREYPEILTHQERFHRFTLPNQSVIEYGFAECEADLSKWQGSEFSTIIVDEVQFMDRVIIDYLPTILRTTIPGLPVKMLWTGNPGGRMHSELKRMFIDRKFKQNENPAEYTFVKSLVADNPSLPASYTEQLKSLPEHLRKAYLEGSWDSLMGSFFSLHPHVLEEPSDLTEDDCRKRLYGSLDYGVSHATSFGLHYMDLKGCIHRLFSYLASEVTADQNAIEIADRIKTFTHTRGAQPLKVFADASMWSESRLTQSTYWSPIETFMKHMDKAIQWVPATRDKQWSCQILKGMLDPKEGEPMYVVWRPYNQSWVEEMARVEIDMNRPEVYTKAPGDDVADETRYGAAAMYSLHNDASRAQSLRTEARQRSMGQPKKDWYSM